MKKIIIAVAASLAVVLVSVKWMRSAPSQAPGVRQDNTITFRIVFGEKQERAEDYSGSISLSQGKIVSLKPWRFFGGDSLDGAAGWKLNVKYATFENEPDQPRPINYQGQTRNLIPEGVTVTVEAPSTATAHVKSAEGQFDIRLQDVRYGRVLWFRDGDVSVQRTPASQQISPPAEGPGSEEHDYPSVVVTRKGVVWTAWQAYKDNGDHVYVRHSTASGWSEPFRLTDEKGDVFETAVAEDPQGLIWVVWSERKGEEWDLYARSYDGSAWSARTKLTSGNHPNIYHRLVADPSGALHLLWTGYQDGQSHVLWSKLSGKSWSAPRELSGPSAWAPGAAFDSKGNLYVAWDSYRAGNYDIFLRRISADGSMGEIQQVTKSPRFQAHPTVAVDKQDRVWVAWDESGANWGKDWNRDDMWRGTVLYASRNPKVAVLENGQWKQPAADIMAAVPKKYNRYIELPEIASDSSGRIWMSLELRTACGTNRADYWANNGHWERFLTSYEGDHWAPLTPIPDTNLRNGAPFQMRAGVKGVWMVWGSDNRPQVAAGGGGGGHGEPGEGAKGQNKGKGKGQGKAKGAGAAQGGPRKPAINEVDAASFQTSAAAATPMLVAFDEGAGKDSPVHRNEDADVARMRTYRTAVDGTSYRILRGDFHRHTEISGDGAGDGTIEDYFRYVLDAAEMDTGIITDHNAGDNNEYTWWRTEKAHDIFHIANRHTPLFGYERSVNYPNGHRNVIFPERGVRTLPVTREEQTGQINSGPLVYPYLKQHRGVCFLHSLATDQGSDYRDNDPEVEPLVEIYQGYHANYEYEAAPRAETESYTVQIHGAYRPKGFYWNALAKGYKLGVESSSDHISTHSSYTMIYTPSTNRSDIVESLRKRHAYGATDNILVDYSATGADGRVHMMGEALSSTTAPKLAVKVVGTERIQRIEIVKDGKFVFETEPEGTQAQFVFQDKNPGKGTSYYYVRVIQVDRNMAWSSPIWVDYGK
jgi:hypothetical protein